MRFVTYFELNEDRSSAQRIEAIDAHDLMEHYPPEGVDVLEWGLTPDRWGFAIYETDDIEALEEALELWRLFEPWYETTKTAPFRPIDDSVETVAELVERV